MPGEVLPRSGDAMAASRLSSFGFSGTIAHGAFSTVGLAVSDRSVDANSLYRKRNTFSLGGTVQSQPQTKTMQVSDYATIVHLLFLSCASEGNPDMLSGVCFFDWKRHQTVAPLLKCQLSADSKHCVVWQGAKFADTNVVAVGACGSSSEQAPSNLQLVSLTSDCTRCVSLLGLTCGAAFF